MKILAPFSLYFDFGCHFGCHPNRAGPDRIYLRRDSRWCGREGPKIRFALLQTGSNSRDSLCSINASARSR